MLDLFLFVCVWAKPWNFIKSDMIIGIVTLIETVKRTY